MYHTLFASPAATTGMVQVSWCQCKQLPFTSTEVAAEYIVSHSVSQIMTSTVSSHHKLPPASTHVDLINNLAVVRHNSASSLVFRSNEVFPCHSEHKSDAGLVESALAFIASCTRRHLVHMVLGNPSTQWRRSTQA